MRNVKFAFAVVAALLLVSASGFAGKDAAWFDLEGCQVCSKMSAEKGLMEHMDWENHVIKDGMLSVTTVDPQYREAFARAGKAMHEMGARMAKGEKMHLCGFCSSMGELLAKGAQEETVPTATGQIMLVTSSDPELAGAIRKHAQRTIDEFAKMMQAEAHRGSAH